MTEEVRAEENLSKEVSRMENRYNEQNFKDFGKVSDDHPFSMGSSFRSLLKSTLKT